jgi:cobalt/nickel transport system permease protein
MHIPSSMLNGAVCPVTVAVAVAGTGLAVHFARKADEQPSVMKFSAVTAMVFALQMLNFTVQNGTSGHLMGSVLAMPLLGVPYAVISMAVVLTVQAVFFGDGGINTLGANVINMALIGAGAAGFLFEILKKTRLPKLVSIGIAAGVSVMAAAAACSLEVAWAGAVSLNKVIPAMLSVHALIGIGEIAITVGILAILAGYQKAFKANEALTAMAAFAIAVSAAMLSPFASNFPDGLEYISKKLAFTGFSGINMNVLFNDYQVSLVSNAGLSTIGAGLAGIAIIFIVSQITAKSITLHQVVK